VQLTTERPVAIAAPDTDPSHISAVMPLVVRGVADAAILNQGGKLDHPNRVALRAFVAREIAAARKMSPVIGHGHLLGCIARVQANQQDTGHPTRKVRKHNVGLTLFDFGLALSELGQVERELRGVDARKVMA